MHFCRICRTEKNLKYTVKELRKFSRKRCTDKVLSTTPTLGNICHECEERLHNFHSLDEDDNGDNEDGRIIVDDDDLLYNLFFEKMEQQRIMKRLIATGSGVGGSASSDVCSSGGTAGNGWRTTTLRQQTLVAATAASGVADIDVIEVLTSRENTPSPSTLTTRSATPVSTYQPQTTLNISSNVVSTTTLSGDETSNQVNTTASNGTTSIANNTATTTTTKKSNKLVCTKPVADKVKSSPYKVVAVIDLDDDDEEVTLPTFAPITTNSALLTPSQTTPDSDEEEIVFRKVEPDDGQNCNNYKRNRKSSTRKGKYQNRQINLIASLSLVSSDNDSDVEVTIGSEKSPTKPNTTKRTPQKATIDDENVVSTTTEQLSPPPSNCSTDDGPKSSPTTTRSSASSRDTTQPELVCQLPGVSVKCPVCSSAFVETQHLIKHMRRKHRSYDGVELTERPRCAQDSAMTIRLRYMQRFNYYECQLCGCIDAVFKMHKQHIMAQHPIESKTLKDPMMQQLKCPVCKEKCGTQHIELLRHMLQAHKVAQCRAHFRQVTQIRNLFTNCSGGKKEKELQRTAKIYQINKRKQYYFECIQCRKIVSGYYNHVQHQSSHISKKVGGNVIKPQTTTTTKVVDNSSKKNDKPKTAAATARSTPDTVTRRAAKPSCNEKKVEKPTKVKGKEKESINKKKLSLGQRNSAQQQKVQQQQKLQQQQKVQQNPQQQQQSRRKRKLSKAALKAALVKIKVKAPLKQLPTQRYQCNLCSDTFKGFHRLNLHIINLHTSNNDDGILRCSICKLRFAQDNELEQHEQLRHICKQKRKGRAQKQQEEASDTVKQQQITRNDGCDKNFEQEEKCFGENGLKVCKRNQTDLESHTDTKRAKTANADMYDVNASWLQELLALASHNKQSNEQNVNQMQNNNAKSNDNDEEKGQNKLNSICEQCLYCGHLFNSLKELNSHEYMHVQRKEAKQLKRYSNDIFMKKSS